MTIDFRPRGVCSQRMTVEIEDGIIRSLRIMGGCSGNLQGIAALVRACLRRRPSSGSREFGAALSPLPARINLPRPSNRPERVHNTVKKAALNAIQGGLFACSRLSGIPAARLAYG